jgi:hypothetical protein
MTGRSSADTERRGVVQRSLMCRSVTEGQWNWRRMPLVRNPDVAAVPAVDRIIELVSQISVDGAVNIYDEKPCIAAGDAPREATFRREALRHYLTNHWTARFLLVGEAPGKNGARWSGVPFTSQRQLTGEGPAEPSATIVHAALSELECQNKVMLWNASVLYPPGNRDPTPTEIAACRGVFELVSRGRTVFAIGRHAELATGGAPYIRHPSYGGKSLFVEGLRIAVTSKPGVDVRKLLSGLRTSAPSSRTSTASRAIKPKAAQICPSCHLILPRTGVCDCQDA